jgi:hypothetical protein
MMDWTDKAEFDYRLNDLAAPENRRSLYVASRGRFSRCSKACLEATALRGSPTRDTAVHHGRGALLTRTRYRCASCQSQETKEGLHRGRAFYAH